MKSKFDLKHNIGKVKIETLDDLWILKEIITPGIFVTAKTTRSIEIIRGGEKEKVGRRPVVLKLFVEKIEFGEKLKLIGKIVEAPEDIEKGYHSIDVQVGSILTIEKEWRSWEVSRIKASERKAEPILVCILDEMEADFYLLKEREEHLLHLSSPGLAKEGGVSRKAEYYGNILSQLKSKSEGMKKIVIAGPAFTREEVISLVLDKAKELSDKIITDALSHTGEVGLQELLNRGVIDKITKTSRIVEETAMIEKVLVEIAKDGKAVYGKENTERVVDMGAVDTLIVSIKRVRDFEDIMKKAEKTKTRIMIVASNHQSGEKLLGLGGIAGLLRYKPF